MVESSDTRLDGIHLRAYPLHELLPRLSEGCDKTKAGLDYLPENLLSIWLEAVSPHEPHKLERRLSWDNIDVSKLSNIVQSNESLSDDHTLAINSSAGWISSLVEVTKSLQNQWDRPLSPYQDSKYLLKQLPFVDLWLPVYDRGLELLKQNLASQMDEFDIHQQVLEDLANSLLERLVYIGEQLLWSQFSANRGPGAVLMAHLGPNCDGLDPPSREYYNKFIQQHRRDGLRDLLDEFPVFGRLIGTAFSLWLDGSTETIKRVSNDNNLLQTAFGISPNTPLVSISQGLSDPHRGGRAVSILTYGTDDNTVKIVYKPKDMRLDKVYQDMLGDLNQHSKLVPLKTLTVLCADGYGYMEFVPHRLCENEQSLTSFYHNAGRLTAVLHVLGCTDCHHENLIAFSDQLVLIDTETLLEADLPDHIADASTQNDNSGPSELQKRFRGSILRSGLLPNWMFIGANKIAMDVSALGISPPSQQDERQRGWLGLNSDGMLAGFINRSSDLPTSLPINIGQPNPLEAQLNIFCKGFQEECTELMARSSAWLGPNGLLANFIGLPRRIVLRATRVYFSIQNQLLQPEALRSPFHQAIKLEQLARSFLLAEEMPKHWSVFAAELIQMQQLDIPIFVHPIDGSDLPLLNSLPPVEGFMETSGLTASQKRLQQLDDEAVSFQLRLIRGSIEASSLRESDSKASHADIDQTELSNYDLPTPLQAATQVASKLLTTAIYDEDENVEWLGIDLGADGDKFSFGPVGISLYGGSSGIAVLLSRLHNLGIDIEMDSNRPGGKETIYSILKPLNELFTDKYDDWRLRWWRDQSLGLSGCGGLLLALQYIELQPQFNESSTLAPNDIAKNLFHSAVKSFLENDTQLDIIGGVAGLIGPLLILNTELSLQLAVDCGDHLITTQADNGSWVTSPKHPALLGFSHGNAGFAAALARLHAASGEIRFHDAAASALAYERSKFSLEEGNWPDFRTRTQADTDAPLEFMSSWCHGAPGIGLGRACLWGTTLWDEQCAEEITVALQTTAAVRSLGTDHLCCGSLGLMVLLQLLSSGPWPIDEKLRNHCQEVATQHRLQALRRCSVERIDLRCFGTHKGTLALPGFFTGLSGMGLALLDDHPSRVAMSQLISSGLWPNQ